MKKLHPFLLAGLTLLAGAESVLAADAGEKAFDEIEPILMDFCYDCHGDGMDKGDFAMDDYETVAKHLEDFDVYIVHLAWHRGRWTRIVPDMSRILNELVWPSKL